MCLFLFPHYYSRHLAKMIRSMKSQHQKCLPWYSISRGFHVYFLIQGDSQDADTQMTNGWAKPWYELLFRIWPDLCWYFKPNPRAAAIFCWGPFLHPQRWLRVNLLAEPALHLAVLVAFSGLDCWRHAAQLASFSICLIHVVVWLRLSLPCGLACPPHSASSSPAGVEVLPTWSCCEHAIQISLWRYTHKWNCRTVW